MWSSESGSGWMGDGISEKETHIHSYIRWNQPQNIAFFFSSFLTVFSMNKVKCLPFFFSLYFSKRHFPLCLFSWIIFLIVSIPNTFHRWNFICANLCQLVSSNDVKKKNGTEKETVTFFGKTKTSQQLTHICLGRMCLCVCVIFFLVLSMRIQQTKTEFTSINCTYHGISTHVLV